MALRDYQRRLLDDVWSLISRAPQNVLAVMPTGAGKTVTMAALARAWPDYRCVICGYQTVTQAGIGW